MFGASTRPKVYLADTGLLHALVGVGSAVDLAAHPKVGASWESFGIDDSRATAERLRRLPQQRRGPGRREEVDGEHDLIFDPRVDLDDGGNVMLRVAKRSDDGEVAALVGEKPQWLSPDAPANPCQ